LQEILNDYRILRAEFLNAKLVAASVEDFTEAIYPIRDKLPVIKQEIGDTWINGIQSDPLKVAKMKLVMRNRAECLQKGMFCMKFWLGGREQPSSGSGCVDIPPVSQGTEIPRLC
jgi:hypothetical protein